MQPLKRSFFRRWLGYFALTIVVAVTCCSLGTWQFARRAEAVAENTRIENNYDSTPIALVDALPTRDSFTTDQKWLPVTLNGTYLFENEILVRNRPRNGQPGFEVLTPFLLANGTVFFIDRGWLPTGSTHDLPDEIPQPPAGKTQVVVRLKPGEPTIAGRGAPENQLATVHLDDLAARSEYPSYRAAYGVLATEKPEPTNGPYLLPKPLADEGPHLSYALQWFVFAALALAGFVYALAMERKNTGNNPTRDRSSQTFRKRHRAISDAEVEDGILDGQRH